MEFNVCANLKVTHWRCGRKPGPRINLGGAACSLTETEIGLFSC